MKTEKELTTKEMIDWINHEDRRDEMIRKKVGDLTIGYYSVGRGYDCSVCFWAVKGSKTVKDLELKTNESTPKYIKKIYQAMKDIDNGIIPSFFREEEEVNQEVKEAKRVLRHKSIRLENIDRGDNEISGKGVELVEIKHFQYEDAFFDKMLITYWENV